MWDVLLDAFLDTLKLSWLLLIFYILIELIEQKIAVKMHDKLKSKYAVAVGAGFGIVPQCGFSVLASDLYSKKQITLGALLAVFIATSDEALPILFSSLNQKGVWLKLLMLIGSKLILALIAGYSVDLIVRAASKKKIKNDNVEVNDNSNEKRVHAHNHQHEHSAEKCENVLMDSAPLNIENEHIHDDHDHDHDDHNHEIEETVDIHKGCCGHHIDDTKESNVKKYLVHPLLHTLKILAYILIVNIIMGVLVHFIGEDRIAEFMSKSGVLQPILVTMVGLIPNCASSVIITELFLNNTISFGSCLGGLIVNAGLGLAFLFKANKNFKQNIAITAGLFAFALIIAIAFHFII